MNQAKWLSGHLLITFPWSKQAHLLLSRTEGRESNSCMPRSRIRSLLLPLLPQPAASTGLSYWARCITKHLSANIIIFLIFFPNTVASDLAHILHKAVSRQPMNEIDGVPVWLPCCPMDQPLWVKEWGCPPPVALEYPRDLQPSTATNCSIIPDAYPPTDSAMMPTYAGLQSFQIQLACKIVSIFLIVFFVFFRTCSFSFIFSFPRKSHDIWQVNLVIWFMLNMSVMLVIILKVQQ